MKTRKKKTAKQLAFQPTPDIYIVPCEQPAGRDEQFSSLREIKTFSDPGAYGVTIRDYQNAQGANVYRNVHQLEPCVGGEPLHASEWYRHVSKTEYREWLREGGPSKPKAGDVSRDERRRFLLRRAVQAQLELWATVRALDETQRHGDGLIEEIGGFALAFDNAWSIRDEACDRFLQAYCPAEHGGDEE